MTYKDALELLNIFTMAAQNAKKKNKFECRINLDASELASLLKKAFPSSKNDYVLWAEEILKNS